MQKLSIICLLLDTLKQCQGRFLVGRSPAKASSLVLLSTTVGIYNMRWLLQASQIFGIAHSSCLMLAQDDGSGPVCDGVFRALPDGQSEAGKVGVAPKRGL